MNDYKGLLVSVDGFVARITLDQPERLNAFDELLHEEFPRALDDVKAMSDIRALLITGNGKVFSAGGDFDFMRRVHENPAAFVGMIDEGLHIVESLASIPIPVVAGVNGDAMGLGATIVLLCDAVVAHRRARICDPHVVAGLAAGDGGCLVWPQAVGMIRAKRHLLTGDPVTAEDGFAMGIVTDLVETRDDVLPAAEALATRMASLSPVAVQGTKRAINKLIQLRAAEVLELSMAYETRSLYSDDLIEAVDALQNGRAPVFKGH